MGTSQHEHQLFRAIGLLTGVRAAEENLQPIPPKKRNNRSSCRKCDRTTRQKKSFDCATLQISGSSFKQGMHESRLGPTKEIHIFDKEGSAGIDVKVPSTDNLEMLVWVNACTDDVQNGRQIVATGTVTLIENQSDETSQSSGQRAAQGVTLKAKWDLEREHLPFHNIIFVYCSMLTRSSR